MPRYQNKGAVVGRTTAIALMAVIWALWGGQALQDREHELQNAEALVSSLATAAESQVNGTLRTVDAFLSEAANRISPDAWPDQALQSWFAVRLEGIPEIRNVVIVDADFQVIGDSFGRANKLFPGRSLVLDDDTFVQRTREATRAGDVVIGAPLVSAFTGKPTIPMAKAMRAPDGSVTGWVIAGIKPEIFRDQLAAVVIEERGGATLFGQGTVVLARVPGHESFLGHSFGDNPLTEEVRRAAPKGVRQFISPVDGHDKVVAYRQFDRFPLFITIGLTKDTALRHWRNQATAEGVALMALSAVLLWLAHVYDRRAGVERRLAQQNAAGRDMAEHMLVERSRFFAAASHDLRQPVHTLRLLTTALMEEVRDGKGEVAEDVRDLVADVDESSATLADFLEELLDISRLEAGAIVPSVAECALQPIFDELRQQFQPVADTAGVMLNVVPTSCRVRTDPALCRRVLANLLSNAIKFAEGGSVLLGCRRRGDCVEIQVADNGVGIAEQDREAIFDDFRQLGHDGNAKKGVGLGLAIVRRIVAVLGHPLSMQSQVGRGTLFSLTLPRVTADRRI